LNKEVTVRFGKLKNAAVGFDVLTSCQPSTVWCSWERMPAAAAQPAKVHQSCSATDLFYLLFIYCSLHKTMSHIYRQTPCCADNNVNKITITQQITVKKILYCCSTQPVSTI
jgi:hypothetical protein